MDTWRYLRVAWFFARMFLSTIWWDLFLRHVPGLSGSAQRNALPRWQALVEGREGFYLEDKGWSLALHARFAPEKEATRVISAIGSMTPALLTRMSRPPSRPRVSATARSNSPPRPPRPPCWSS